MELQLLTKEEAEAHPVGKERKEPNQVYCSSCPSKVREEPGVL